MAKYEDLKELTEALKNIFTLGVYLMFTVLFIFYAAPFIRQTLKSKAVEISKVEIAGITLNLSDKLNEPVRTETKNAADVKVDLVSKQAAIQVDSAIGKDVNTYWVYLGQHYASQNTWVKSFKFQTIPNPTSTISAATDVFKRDNMPVKINDDSWQLGRIIGVVKQNATVQVIRVEKIEGDNYWAMVK